MNATKASCVGCRESFRNAGTQTCWSLPTARVIHRVRLKMGDPAGDARSYAPARVPQCYSSAGFIFLNDLPEYAK